MKSVQSSTAAVFGLTGRKPHRMPKPRSTYPTVSLVRLQSGPLRKLAWIFGFCH
jgi:hypothetical protein